jgi:hypothetical protein
MPRLLVDKYREKHIILPSNDIPTTSGICHVTFILFSKYLCIALDDVLANVVE